MITGFQAVLASLTIFRYKLYKGKKIRNNLSVQSGVQSLSLPPSLSTLSASLSLSFFPAEGVQSFLFLTLLNTDKDQCDEV